MKKINPPQKVTIEEAADYQFEPGRVQRTDHFSLGKFIVAKIIIGESDKVQRRNNRELVFK
ncbi:hypothetical protein ACWOAH_06985 [Vagococcus vulneris]|uniref:Uncharacterized protein n=1 Tax=Vagococcus vulneris TaxID=1977869 RepID=A0A429ZYC2_9ENTE|nr:hypothetical protein [Vagococcus vulneris]RST98946.1 hypothetical protein CBF37_06140 [Vagococcus vulneris]